VKRLTLIAVSCLLLAACDQKDTLPPALAISSPAVGSPVSGTVAVQVNAIDNNANLGQVDLYVRGKGSTGKGVFAGSSVSTQSPYVVSWNSEAQPNQAELELVAVGKDQSGNESESSPVAVKTQNASSPNLQLLTAYTLIPNGSAGAPAAISAQSLEALNMVSPLEVLPPANFTNEEVEVQETTTLTAQAGTVSYLLEWMWDPYTAAATGNGIYFNKVNLAGPYELVTKRATSAAPGVQKYTKTLTDAKEGDSYYGLVTGIGANSAETGFSNADKTTFIPMQSVATPTGGASLLDGRPTLSWTKNTKADGYLYYVYDKNPWESGAKILWTNPVVGGKRQSTELLSASYPVAQAALPAGTYYWWVVGLSFDRATGKVDAMSFSEARSFNVQ
jgi:Bacterial Ig domain